ncbi:MAG: putative integral membrane protein [Candidatus Pelagisphaera sp.]|jgi:uncharacterized integral membrane protein
MNLSTKIKFTTVAAIAILSIVVFFQNTESVDTRILFFVVSMPRAFLLLCATLVGFMTGIACTLVFTKNRKNTTD